MADVVKFPGITKLDLPAERVLDQAKEHGLNPAIVIGWDGDGELYFATRCW